MYNITARYSDDKIAKRAATGYLHNIVWSDFGFVFSWKCIKWVKQEDDRAVGRLSLTREELQVRDSSVDERISCSMYEEAGEGRSYSP